MFYQISHLSEPGMPINMPYANGNFYVSRFLVTEAEQSKYTTELQSELDDPTRHPETFLFLPSLRRSLRLTAAARCGPITASDFVQDDNAYNPPLFQVDFLGEKKTADEHSDPAKAYDAHSYVGLADPTAGEFPGWPKAGSGHWELRTIDVIDLKWISALGPYCFSHRVYYTDRETWVALIADEYVNNGKLWKTLWIYTLTGPSGRADRSGRSYWTNRSDRSNG